jgi:hypothetical protein
VSWKDTVNHGLSRATGYELRKVGAPAAGKQAARRTAVGKARAGDRLVDAPVFIMCTLRSGSTLLRVLLDSHSQIHAPHELHLRYITVAHEAKWSDRSMKEMGLDQKALEYLLWDRILHRELAGSGKSLVVDKTPNNVFIPERLRECWPDARFIFLLRHPAAIARSRQAVKGEDFDEEKNVDLIRRYCEALESARQTYDGHTVRYEEITSDPAPATKGICDFLGLPWEAGMLEYGKHDHGRYKAGLGDWADKIQTGQIQKPEPPPAETPAALRPIAERWGYLEAGSEASAAARP